MTVHFDTFDIENATEKHIKNFISRKYNIQPFQILFNYPYIVLTNKVGESFAYIAEYEI